MFKVNSKPCSSVFIEVNAMKWIIEIDFLKFYLKFEVIIKAIYV